MKDPLPPPNATDAEVAKFWETHSVADYWDDIPSAEGWMADAMRLLRELEWNARHAGDCPSCERFVVQGHDDTCALAILLRDHRLVDFKVKRRPKR